MEEKEATQGTSGSPAPFLTKTYDMVDDPSTDAVVSWSPTNSTSFIVWNLPVFSRDLLPKYFKHNNFASFVRQLNTYGFRKVDPDQWEFRNDDFVRGHRELLYKIQRRKPVHSHSLHNQINNLGQSAEQERQELEGLIENLKQDKCILMTELQNHMQQQYGMVQQMQSLEEKLHALEQRQKYMMIFFSKMIQRPGSLTHFLRQSDLHSKKRRLPKDNWFTEDATMQDNGTESFKTLASGKSDMLQQLDMEHFEKMESSLSSLENLFRSVSQASGDNMYYDSTVPCLPSAIIITEMSTSSGETDFDLQSSALKSQSSSFLEDVHSSPELVESATCEERPAIRISEAFITDAWNKVSEIDVNSEPSVHNNDSSRNRTMADAASTVPTGANDVFWEQFLTETPGSTQEVQSEGINSDEKTIAGNDRPSICIAEEERC